jgi:hypothetical protein
LFNVAIVILETELGDDAVVVVLFLNVDGENVVIGHGRNYLEEVRGVGANDDFLGETDIFLEFVGIELDIDNGGVVLVEIDDFHALCREGNGGIDENILESCYEIANGLYLHRFYREYIVIPVH